MFTRIHRTAFLFLTLLVFLAGISLVRDARAGVFFPETFFLENGMQVVVVSNHRVPVVTHMVWYKVGSADEEPGESGIAHLLEHLMFKGTPSFPDGAFSKILARNGGRENAFTYYDYTGYYQTVAKDFLELVMEMEADRMTNLVLTPEQIETEILVVLEERRTRVDNSPAAILGEQINASLFINYPYRQPIIGWEHEIRQLDYDALMAFYKRWYAPNNAILIVGGDITADQLRPLAEKYYGSIPRANMPERGRPSEPPHHAEQQVVYHDERVRQPSWQRVYLAPSYVTGATEHAYPLEILADVLGGGSTSRLYRSLIIDRQLAVSAGAYYDPGVLGPAKFGFYASPRPGVEMTELVAAIDHEIEKIFENGISQEELERAVRSMNASAIYARDSLTAGARVFGSALTSGQTIEDVESWPDRVALVTVDEVTEAAKAVFVLKNAVSAELLRKEQGPAWNE